MIGRLGDRGALRHAATRLKFEPLESRLVLNGTSLLISEFMAVNGATLADESGAYPDWIEVHNPTAASVDLDGYYLTDSKSNSTKWAFPDISISPGEYLVVFASGDDRSVAGSELHTNFKLSGDGEYLALVDANGPTVVHEFDPEFPRQLTDISYGLPDASIISETLVSAGAAARYEVPAFGEDPTGWTAEDFDDSAWTDSFAVDPAGLLITEVSTGDVHSVEIQNVFHESIDTSGWRVLVNNGSGGNVNTVNSAAWSLPVSIGPGEIRYRTDDPSDNYWNAPIDWQLDGPGWVMIVDGDGRVMDFAAWGYTSSQLAGLSIDYGDFSDITLATQWSGDAAEPGSDTPEGPGETGFVAYNDHRPGAGTHANTTSYTPDTRYAEDVAAGLLQDIVTGLSTSVTLTTTQSGVDWEGSHGSPASGTDAHDLFNGFVDFSGASGSRSSISISGNDHITHTFSGLDEGEVVTYNFAGTTVRGRDGYDNRWTRVSLVGAAESTAAHSAGIGLIVLSDTEVAVWTGENHNANQGFVAAWTQIDPGPDGQFSIVSQQYQEATPGVGSGTADGKKGYGIAGIRLEEVAPAGPTAWLRRTGGFDTDSAADFTRSATPSLGEQNPDMTVPFGETRPVTTGIGFSDGQPEFDQLIQTDVADAMQGVNGSLWVRIPFEVADPTQFDELILRMQYDDGFIAYINGVEATRKNFEGTLTSTSTAASTRPDSQAVVFESYGISGSLDALQVGTNILAIHALNVTAADGDLLIVPELVANGLLDGPQYMTTPTPRAANVPGAVGSVADTKFSIDRGFFDAPFELEITTKTSGSTIRYTTDGSKPTTTSGIPYTGPITISETTTLRAVAYRPGYIETNVDTQTYLFLDDILQQDATGLPDTWGYSGGNIKSPPGPDYAMDAAVVADNAATIRDDLKSIPTVSLVTDLDNWFGTGGQGIYVSGVGVPTSVSMEYFTGDGVDSFHVDGSVEIQGGGFGGTSANRWKSYKLSMQLKFKEEYGDSKLRFPIFGDEGTNQFDTLILDAHLNLTWTHPSSSQQTTAQFIQDGFISDLQNAMGGYAPHGRWVHLYLNGLYWGMYELHERPDEHFASEYLGGVDDDYNVLKHSMNNVANGSNTSYQELLDRVRMDMTDPANYESVLELLDADSLIDYMLANFYGGNTDWAHKNWYAGQNGVDPDGRWRFHSWDAEHVLKNVNENVTGKSNTAGPTEIHTQLTYNAEYRLLFADHVHRHLHNDGPLSPTGAAALYQNRVSEVDRAIVGESARWGDNRRDGNAYTRDDWRATVDGLFSNYFPDRTDNLIGYLKNQTDNRDLYPAVDAPVYQVSGELLFGGAVEPAEPLTMSGSGRVYYTLDGSDPRMSGGAIATTAIWYTSAIYLSETTLVKARAMSDGVWSALSEARFYVGTSATAENLLVTEINYHPQPPTSAELILDPASIASNFEFVELTNIGNEWIDLTSVEFANGIAFDFTDSAITRLDPGESVVVVHDAGAFAARYNTAGILLAGPYEGNLANNGEPIRLLDRLGEPIFNFSYDDDGGWPGRADGKGATLELRSLANIPTTDPERTAYLENDDHWQSSIRYGGSPGDQPDAALGIVVNEVLTHTDLPDKDTIELHNTTGSLVNIGGWFLSDSWGWDTTGLGGNYRQFRIPGGLSIPGGGYLTFDEDDFNPGGGTLPTDFALSGVRGDDVWLMAAESNGTLTHFADHVEFDAAANGEPIGRWPNAIGEFYPMDAPTLGDVNEGPRVGPVILSEVMYNPTVPDGDPNDFEFIEIYNGSPDPIDLTDWRTRKGVDFDFSAGTILPSGEILVVVSFDEDDSTKMTAFRDHYGLDGSVTIVGPYDGKLNDDGEKVQLQRPDDSPQEEPEFIPRLLEDEVIYGDLSPWPEGPDGGGPSLHRVAADAWGNDPASWTAATATPGSVAFDPVARVTDRRVFYNGSKFDGDNFDANLQDDNAVATDKTALLPGETATAENYTSYSRGINGIMVDLAGPVLSESIGPADFLFRTGNNDDPSSWTLIAAPDISVHAVGEGHRVTLNWRETGIQNKWLQVTVVATANTGLLRDDVFYFGNAIGETGDSNTHAMVNATDEIGTRNHQHGPFNPAEIDDRYDFNRDRLVNATDQIHARANQTSPFAALRLIAVPEFLGNPPPPIGATPDSASSASDALFASWRWIGPWESLRPSSRTSTGTRSATDAVDKLLANYW